MLMTKNFTAEEKQAIEELKERTKDEHTPRVLQDETIFYRFLKARNFNMKQAEKLLRMHFEDRKFYGFDNLLEWYTYPEHMETYVPVTFLGFDKEGSSIRYIDVGNADVKGIVNLFDFKQMTYYAGYNIELDVERMTEQSIKTGIMGYQFLCIMNLENMSLFTATYRKGLEFILQGIKLYLNNFPERVNKIYVINASTYFPIIFSVVKTVLPVAAFQKIHIYGTTGWQEKLLEHIDENTLPAFLGGKRTDPDGNPRCNTFMCHGRRIPAYLYDKKCKKSIKDENGVKKVMIARQCSTEVDIRVDEPSTNIEWEFEVKWGSVASKLCYKQEKENSSLIEERTVTETIKTDLPSEMGTYTCHKAGLYTIVFDNSSSWIYSKEVYYRIRLVNLSQSERSY